MSHRNWVTVFVLTLSLCLIAETADAKGKGKSKSRKGPRETLVSGVIDSVGADGGSFVFQPKVGGKRKSAMPVGEPLRLTINAGTTIMVDGATGRAADLRAGMYAKVRFGGSYTSSIQASTPGVSDQGKKPNEGT
jgi:hypothetical protein